MKWARQAARRCTAIADGKELLEAGKRITYVGASSALNFDQYNDVTPDFSGVVRGERQTRAQVRGSSCKAAALSCADYVNLVINGLVEGLIIAPAGPGADAGLWPGALSQRGHRRHRCRGGLRGPGRPSPDRVLLIVGRAGGRGGPGAAASAGLRAGVPAGHPPFGHHAAVDRPSAWASSLTRRAGVAFGTIRALDMPLERAWRSAMWPSRRPTSAWPPGPAGAGAGVHHAPCHAAGPLPARHRGRPDWRGSASAPARTLLAVYGPSRAWCAASRHGDRDAHRGLSGVGWNLRCRPSPPRWWAGWATRGRRHGGAAAGRAAGAVRAFVGFVYKIALGFVFMMIVLLRSQGLFNRPVGVR